MTNSISADENTIKALFKAALVEVLEENQDLVRSLLVEALEDMAIVRAVEEGEQTNSVSKEEIFKVLRGE